MEPFTLVAVVIVALIILILIGIIIYYFVTDIQNSTGSDKSRETTKLGLFAGTAAGLCLIISVLAYEAYTKTKKNWQNEIELAGLDTFYGWRTNQAYASFKEERMQLDDSKILEQLKKENPDLV